MEHHAERLLRTFFASSLALMFSMPLLAQGTRDTTAVLRGSVLDEMDRPVVGVEVRVTTHGKSARTDSAGRFVVRFLFASPARVVLRLPGWTPVDTMVGLGDGQTTEWNARMSRQTSLDTVRVISQDDCPTRTLEGFQCRRRAGLGVFRDSADLAAIGVLWSADYLYGVPGLRRVPGMNKVTVESLVGWRCLRTYIDGRPTKRDDQADPKDYKVIAVEYYDTPDKIPAWYRIGAVSEYQYGARAKQKPRSAGGGYVPGRAEVSTRNCGLIVYWTDRATRFDPRLDQSKDVQRTRGKAPPSR